MADISKSTVPFFAVVGLIGVLVGGTGGVFLSYGALNQQVNTAVEDLKTTKAALQEHDRSIVSHGVMIRTNTDSVSEIKSELQAQRGWMEAMLKEQRSYLDAILKEARRQ